MKRSREVNPIDVVEAAYDLSLSDGDWLSNLARLVRPLIDGGHGLLAYTFDRNAALHQHQAAGLYFDIDAAHLPLTQRMLQASPDVAAYLHFNNAGLLALIDSGKRGGFGDLRERPEVERYFTYAGIRDVVALQTVEPDGSGVVFAAGQGQERTFDARTHRLWVRVNAHIAAGRRVRAAVAREEAILTPSGKIEHAEGEGATKSAREGLRDAVLRQEKARGKLRKTDPEGATEAWTAMVSGRWSLVDRFERGGRRYVVARRNEHSLADPRALTPRERAIVHLAVLGRPNKLIGYELGLSESTIGSHLSRAMQKLGVTSRVELLRLIMQFGGPPATK